MAGKAGGATARPLLISMRLLFAAILLITFASAQATHSCVVLQYHHFSSTTPPITSITPDQFDAQLNYLQNHHFNIVALRDVVRALQQHSELPDKCVSFSIDDAYISVYTTAYPKLIKRGWPFTVFVNTQAVDQGSRSLMNWNQMREMARHGASFENHSYAHSHMIRRKDNESEHDWLEREKHDIQTAQKRITEETGTAPRLFAYPYGEFNPTLNRLIEKMGFVGFGQQSGPVWPDANLAALPRFPMEGNYARLPGFIVKVNTLPLAVIRAAPKDPLVKIADWRPTLTLRLVPDSYSRKTLHCYLDGSDQLDIVWSRSQQDTLSITPRFDLKPGRHRTNCTLPSGHKGHFRWYSHNWYVRQADGRWYAEY